MCTPLRNISISAFPFVAALAAMAVGLHAQDAAAACVTVAVSIVQALGL